jgi:hypothetical protein
MRGLIALIASAAINAFTIPALASECAPNKDIDAFRSHWATLRSQRVNAADMDKTCRAYAASFYESVTLRQAVAKCAGSERNLSVLDFEVNAFNDLLAMKCGT